VPTLAADHNADDEFGPDAKLLELIKGGGPAWKKERAVP
jgi:hypothetical protein